jgi:hypothetical protein
MKIKIDQADQAFSQVIRLRDMRCMRCGSRVQLNDKGLPVTHQASHYFTRGKERTRFDLQNVDTLCFACHHLWGGEQREKYKEFKVKQLGEKGFIALELASNSYQRKDRVMEKIKWRAVLKVMLKADKCTCQYNEAKRYIPETGLVHAKTCPQR